ncbi:MAG: hypothetical protein LUH15_17460 [Tannerellaceae bacterium]|nr:hypothetical protein [Tannerellaceae bacterium]
MKKYTYFIYTLLFLLTTFVACDREKIDYGLDENEGIEAGIGKLNLSFPLETKASGNYDDFVITIVNSE